MLQFEILRAERGGHGKLSTLDLEEQTLASSGTCLVVSHHGKSAAQENGRKCSPVKITDIPGSPPLSSGAMHLNKQEGRHKHQKACMDEQDAPGQTQDTKRKPTEGGSRDRMSRRNTQKLSKKTRIRLKPENLKEINPTRDFEGNKKTFYRCIDNKRMAGKNVSLFWKEIGDLVTWDMEKVEVFHALFVSVLTSEVFSRTTQITGGTGRTGEMNCPL